MIRLPFLFASRGSSKSPNLIIWCTSSGGFVNISEIPHNLHSRPSLLRIPAAILNQPGPRGDLVPSMNCPCLSPTCHSWEHNLEQNFLYKRLGDTENIFAQFRHVIGFLIRSIAAALQVFEQYLALSLRCLNQVLQNRHFIMGRLDNRSPFALPKHALEQYFVSSKRDGLTRITLPHIRHSFSICLLYTESVTNT